MRPLYEYTLDALRQIVGVSAVTQERLFKENNLYVEMPQMQFIEDFCTIHLKGPRQAGHTMAMLHLIKERFANKVVLIVPNSTTRHHIANKAYDVLGSRWQNRVLVINGARDIDQRYVFNPGSIDAILVDNASYWDHDQLKRIVIDTIRIARGRLDKSIPFFYIMVQ